MEKEKIKEIYEKSGSFELSSKVRDGVNPSTLGEQTLRFIGGLIEQYRPINLLELGSGLSTTFFRETALANSEARLFSVDHSDFYLEKTKELVGVQDQIRFYFCPIEKYVYKRKFFAAYSGRVLDSLPSELSFDLVLIDGPPGFDFGREAALYQILPRVTRDTLIILDDSNREPEQEAMANWRRVFGEAIEIIEFPELKKGLSLVQLDPSKIAGRGFGLLDILKSRRKVKHALASLVETEK